MDQTRNEPEPPVTPSPERRARPLAAPEQVRRAAVRLAVGLVVVAVLVALYWAAPEPQRVDSPWQVLAISAVCLFGYVVFTAWGVMRLSSSRYPVADGMVMVVVMATLIILGYAYAYQAIDVQVPDAFSQPLTRTSAVYFTVTVLTTVGFGDITPVTDSARLAVTSQMLVGVTVISLSLKLIVQSTRTAKAKQTARARERSDRPDPRS